MTIIRVIHGKPQSIELTQQEMSDANTEFVTNWMTGVVKEILDEAISEETAKELGETAYELYCKGDGKTEYECCEQVVGDYR